MDDNRNTFGNKKQDVNLRIGEERMTISIARDPVAEQAMREAAVLVNKTLERYRTAFPSATKKELLSYVALHIANRFRRLQMEQDTLQLEQRLAKLNRDLEETL
ncbi:MAG: cell division protein ZapA [Porphyromonas sp.]|nr:cell division protein ZapA [Porphyromonas sp.]